MNFDFSTQVKAKPEHELFDIYLKHLNTILNLLRVLSRNLSTEISITKNLNR